jgi:hypothetical protein
VQVASPLTAGEKALPNATQTFAATQGAWRFYNNDRVESSESNDSLRDYGREQISQSDVPFVLLAHDQSKLSFPGHNFREDLAELSGKHDIGYELPTMLARRLLLVSMATVTVWHLMADDSPGAIEFKQMLLRLSGRRMKRSLPVTAPAILTGMWSLSAMLDTLEQIDVGATTSLMAKSKLPVPIISTA